MQRVYSDCTCCNIPLSPAEIETNRTQGNYYYTICNACLDLYAKRVMDIIET